MKTVSQLERDIARASLKSGSMFVGWIIIATLSLIYLPTVLAVLITSLPLWAMLAHGVYTAYFAEVEEK